MQRRADRDSQLGGARSLGSFSRGTFNSRNDRDDLYRFSITGRSSVNLELSGLARRTNADIELYRLTRPLQDAVRSIGRIEFRRLRGSQRSANFQFVANSRRGGNSSEQINAELGSGDYIVRVLQRQGSGRYQLRFSNTSILPTPPDNSIPPTTPTPPVVAPPVVTPPVVTPPVVPPPPPPIPLTVPSTVTGNVNSSRGSITYAFNIGEDRDYEFNLAGLTGDADLQILRADQTSIIRNSANAGTTPERFIQTLAPGSYFLRVAQKTPTVNANYQLTVTPLTDNAGNTEATATPIVIPAGNTPLTRIGYVGMNNGTKSPADYYEFTTPASSDQFLTAEMTGLFDNLDIEIYQKPAPGAAIDPDTRIPVSNQPGASAEIFGGTLARGTTFIFKVQPAAPNARTGAGSTYRLELRLTPTQSRPSVARDIFFGPTSSDASNLRSAGGLAYFTANDGRGSALWVSDGTLTGTRRLRNFDLVGQSAAVDGILYFTANDGTRGNELWRSDGTANGTRIVSDFRPGTAGLNPGNFTVVENRLYFIGQPGETGSRALYYLSNDPADPNPIKLALDPSSGIDPLEIRNLTAAGNTLYFTSTFPTTAGTSGIELLRIINASTSTAVETIDIFSGSQNSSPQFLTPVGNTLFFQARNINSTTGAPRTELFRLNANSTAPTVFDLPPIDFNSNPTNLFEVNGTLYFSASAFDANGNELGRELWALPSAETTSAAPVLVRDIAAGSNSSNPSDLVNLNGTLYFLADDGSGSGKELWRTTTANGSLTAEKVSTVVGDRLNGVTEIGNLVVVGQGSAARLYFTATRSGDTELWFTGGTADDTGSFNISTTTSSNPVQLTNINGRLFFVAGSEGRGVELWSFQGIPVSQT